MCVKLMTSRRLDREVTRETSVKLACTDHGQQALTSDVTLVVRVLDANDNAPRFDATSYGADVIENSFIGTYLTRVSAVDDDDGDNGLVHYILDRDRDRADRGPRPKEKARRPQKDGRNRGRGRDQLDVGIPSATRQLDHASVLRVRDIGLEKDDVSEIF